MDEVLKNQESLMDSLKHENEKYSQLDKLHELDLVVSKARDYHEKLVNIKRNMLIMKERISRLKRKATKLIEDKNREDLERQRSEERREMLERHLEPVVNTKHD